MTEPSLPSAESREPDSCGRSYGTWLLLGVIGVLAGCMLYAEPNPLGALFGWSKEISLRFGASVAPYTMDGQWWRLLAARFIASSIVLLPLFAWPLYLSARQVERALGPATMLLLYCGASLCASLATLVFLPPDRMSLGTVGPTIALASSWLAYRLWVRPAAVPAVKRKWWMISFGLLALLLLPGALSGSLDYGSLSAGACFGLVAGSALAALRKLPKDTQASRSAAVAALAAVLGGTLFALAPQPPYLASQGALVRKTMEFFNQENAALIEARASLVKKFDAGALTEKEARTALVPLKERWQVLDRQLAEAGRYPATPDGGAVPIAAKHVRANVELLDSIIEAARMKELFMQRAGEVRKQLQVAESLSKTELSVPTVRREFVPLLGELLALRNRHSELALQLTADPVQTGVQSEELSALAARLAKLDEEAAALLPRYIGRDARLLESVRGVARALLALNQLQAGYIAIIDGLASATARMRDQQDAIKQQVETYNRQHGNAAN